MLRQKIRPSVTLIFKIKTIPSFIYYRNITFLGGEMRLINNDKRRDDSFKMIKFIIGEIGRSLGVNI